MINLFDNLKDVNRRVFIKGLGYVSLGLIYSTMFGGCERLLKQIANRPVRRRLRTGSTEVDNAIAIYSDAVTQMKALSSSNPRSWAAQVAIHGTVSDGFNFCQHGNNHFFSWHRAYLAYFEQICRELTGEKDFGLPYWNWNQNPDMHTEFTDASSPLFHPRSNTSVADEVAFSDDTMDIIFDDSNFFTFSSQIEGTPHNTTHVVVGGDMVTGGSPLDPVFWPHHCMVDYCWAKWNIELGNDNTNDPGWNNTSWTHFVDGKGDPVTVSAGTTILMPLLSYQYESSVVGGLSTTIALSARSARELEKIEKRLKKGADVRFEIKKRVPIVKGARLIISRPFSKVTRLPAGDIRTLIESDRQSERVFVRINYAMLPRFNDFFVRVFINLPNANAQTSTKIVNYAGSFAFFGIHTGDRDDHQPKTDFLVNVTETLQNLRHQNLLRMDAPISVQLVAVPVDRRFTRDDMELILEEIEFIVSPVMVRSK